MGGREKKLRMRKEKVKKQEQGEGRVEGKGGEGRGGGGGGGGGGRGMVGESKYGCPGHKTSPAARSRTNIRTFPKTNPISPPPTNMVARVYSIGCHARQQLLGHKTPKRFGGTVRSTLQASRNFYQRGVKI